jgi:hypothetical protein
MAKLLQPVKLLRDRYQLQLAHGREMLRREVRPTGPDLDSFKAEVERWDTENRQLINQTYDDPTVIQEYSARTSAAFKADFKQAVLALKDDVAYYITQLEKIDAGLRAEKPKGGCGPGILVLLSVCTLALSWAAQL